MVTKAKCHMRYFFLIFSLFMSSHISFAGKVVFLHGTACAGKTSLCQALAQNNKWKVVCEDDIFYEKAAIRWKSEFPKEFEIIEQVIDKANVLHAVMRNQILFRENASLDMREHTKKAIASIQEHLNTRPKAKEIDDPNSWSNTLRALITKTIIALAKSDNVIVDTWFLKESHIKQISQHFDVAHVMAYCPFSEIVKRTLQRNYQALTNGKDISNLRFFHQTLKSFTGLYNLSPVQTNDAIDTVTKQEMTKLLDIVSVCLTDSPLATGATKLFTRGEFSLQEFEEYRKGILALFQKDTLYICPKFKVNRIIRTDRMNPSESAQVITELAPAQSLSQKILTFMRKPYVYAPLLLTAACSVFGLCYLKSTGHCRTTGSNT